MSWSVLPLSVPRHTTSVTPPRSTLRRLAIDAGADGRGDGLSLVAQPGRNDGAETAGRTARGDHQQMIRRLERRIDAVAAVAHHGALADLGPLGAPDARAFVDELGDVPL